MSKLALGTRASSTFIRALQFAISALILGIFSYYLAVLTKRAGNPAIPRWEKAVEGISGAAVIYTGFAVILTCFLGGITFFAFTAVLLDIAFCGGFIAIAILARNGRRSCGKTGDDSPIGPGEHLSCQLERVTFIVAIIGAFLFLVSAALQVLLSRAQKREKRYGPSPANNYTSGSGKQKFWQRKNRKNKHNKGMHDAELGAVGAGVGAGALAEEKHHHNHNNRNSTIRPSEDTAVAPAVDGYGGSANKYNEPTVPGVAHHNNHNSTYAPSSGYASTNYEPQTSGVTGGHIPEMPSGQTGSHGHPYVQHDSNPYTEVHHGGYVHQNPESQSYARNV